MHIPVLAAELIDSLKVKPEGTYVDCTGGGGGHSELISALLKGGRLFVLDRDIEAVGRLKERFAGHNNINVLHANFSDAAGILRQEGVERVDGLCADFGVSSWQIGTAERGFSFKKDGELDMRMDTTCGKSAKDIVNKYSESLISEIIYRYGEEKMGGRIARAIVDRRLIKPFVSTLDLAAVVKDAVPRKFHKPGYHPATQTFQALRIHVNEELDAIESVLRSLPDLIAEGGRAAFISFHSLEDRLVKESFVRYEHPCTCPPEFPVCNCGKKPTFKVITRKPIIPNEKELKINPLSRSAKLRVAERIGH